MKNRLFITMIAVFFTICSPASWSIENRAIMNPAGSSTVPPSSIQSGLISSPDPFDTSGNLVITGNVRRGMHFRDTVPYGSTTTFRANLGSSTLSSFLRDSAGEEDFSHYADGYSIQPYYLPSQTVTTTRPGYSGVLGPITRIDDRAFQLRYPAGMKTTNGQEKQTLSDWDTFAQVGTSQESSDSGSQGLQTQFGTSAKPIQIVQSIRELQLLTQDRAGISPQDQQLMAERYQKQTQDTGLKTQDSGKALEQRFEIWNPEHRQSQVSEIVQTIEPGFVGDEVTPVSTPAQVDAAVKGPAFQNVPALQKAMGWEPQADEGKPDESGTDLQNQRNRLGSDALERIKQQLDDLTRSIDARLQPTTEAAHKDETTKTDTVSPPWGTAIDWSKIVRLYEPEKAPSSQAAESLEESHLEFSETPNPVRSEPFWQTGGSSVQSSNGANRGSSLKTSSPLDELNKLSQADLSVRARRIRGPHTSFESYSQAKFNQHLQAAENYLRAGRYYRAADSFALASIYKLDEPLCFAGRGHALFAAGEYVSSALFLSRALEIAPEYARTKIDFAAILGGENELDDRIADIKEWLGRSGSDQLEFLLGYVYYRMGRLDQAKQTIDAACEKMPGSLALDAVKKAIDDAIAGQ